MTRATSHSSSFLLPTLSASTLYHSHLDYVYSFLAAGLLVCKLPPYLHPAFWCQLILPKHHPHSAQDTWCLPNTDPLSLDWASSLSSVDLWDTVPLPLPWRIWTLQRVPTSVFWKFQWILVCTQSCTELPIIWGPRHSAWLLNCTQLSHYAPTHALSSVRALL